MPVNSAVVDPFHVSGSSPGRAARVAILGYGTVGSAVARRLVAGDTTRAQLQLTHIFDRRADAKRSSLAPPAGASRAAAVVWTSRIEDIIQSDADVVVEALGGIEPAVGWIRASLLAGKSVVTANKQVVARHGADLWALAARQGRQLRFEAAVGGAMPIVRAVAEGLAGDRICRLDAILNGTTNAVLCRMDAGGCSREEAVADARARGFAERDASADLDGSDAAAKLAILCGLAFGVRIDPAAVPTRSAASIEPGDVARARAEGGTIRQVAHAEYDRGRSALTVWVAPVQVNRDSLFGRTVGPQNAALITGEHSGEIGIFGAGAGGSATAVAALSDVLAIARDRAAIVPPPLLTSNFILLQTSDFRLPTSDFELAEAV